MTNKQFPLATVLLVALLLTTGALADRVRASNLTRLQKLGFKVSGSLPVQRFESAKLRPKAEIEARLEGLLAVVLWVASPDGVDGIDSLRARALDGDLKNWVTQSERDILKTDQPQAKKLYLDSIGWQMESMWSLAWVLGFETPPELSGQLHGELARRLVFGFCLRDEKALRSATEVAATEDLFYCAHNAVRSSQLGTKSTPEGFDPADDGRAVQERRHGLTWCLSPGVSWEQTDLST